MSISIIFALRLPTQKIEIPGNARKSYLWGDLEDQPSSQYECIYMKRILKSCFKRWYKLEIDTTHSFGSKNETDRFWRYFSKNWILFFIFWGNFFQNLDEWSASQLFLDKSSSSWGTGRWRCQKVITLMYIVQWYTSYMYCTCNFCSFSNMTSLNDYLYNAFTRSRIEWEMISSLLLLTILLFLVFESCFRLIMCRLNFRLLD